MPKTYYLSNNLLNVALCNTPFTPPSTIWVALYTVAPGVGGGGTEVTGGGYGRQTVIVTTPNNGQVSNVSDVLFPVASATWNTIVAFSLMDTSSGGNVLYFGNLSTPRLVLASDQVKFASGQLIVQES